MNGAGTFMARDAGVRACPWDREKFKRVGRHETKLKPPTRVPSYLADPSQDKWDNSTRSWLPASAQVGAHYGCATAPAGGRLASQCRTDASQLREESDAVWQRSSDAFGAHCNSDALGLVNLRDERIKFHKGQKRTEVDDTLRWVAHSNSKSEALARFNEDQATKKLAMGVATSGDSKSRQRRRPPDDDEYHEKGVALPPHRLGCQVRVSSKIGQPSHSSCGDDAQFRSAAGQKMQQARSRSPFRSM
ncbi:MAG: hypothetical protein SGPRY_011876 [Prymnesium sp.]